MDLVKQKHSEVLHTAYENAVISNDTFDFIFNNPPYNSDIRPSNEKVDDYRYSMEFDFLARAHVHLCGGGIHVFIVPFDRFGCEKFINFLQHQYIEKELVRFDESEYEHFKQCIFIGRKVYPDYQRTDEDFSNDDYFAELCSKLTFCESYETGLKELSEMGQKIWKVPFAKKVKEITFYSKVDFPEDYKDVSTSSGMTSLLERFQREEIMLDQRNPRNRPKMPISNGQLGLLLASGMVNGSFGEGEHFHLAQGSENVSIHREETVYEYETKIVETTKREAIFNIATRQGVKRLLVKGSSSDSEEEKNGVC